MHSILTLLTALDTCPLFILLMPAVTAFVAVASGANLIPSLEGLALPLALMKLPGLLVQAPQVLQYGGTTILMC
jgi:hypothetical protein